MDREVIIRPKKRGVQMKRQVAYKQGYKIAVCGKFYEVSDTKRVTHYGICLMFLQFKKSGIKRLD